MAHRPPALMISFVFNYMRRVPDAMFVFIDKKAMITYYGRPYNSVVYLYGDFSGDQDDAVLEMHRVAIAMLN